MAVHFYEESPSYPDEQRGRLKPGRSLITAGIPYVVWAEDALSIVHRVPTGLFDQQLLVPDGQVSGAARIICEENNYSVIDSASDDWWGDYEIFNPDRPFAFQGTPSVIIEHNDLKSVIESEEPGRIVIHAASTFHFQIDDPSRTCLNPDPPEPELAGIKFPSLPAFYDALIDTIFEPPLPFIHKKFEMHLHNFVAYLNLYTVSDEGITKADVPPGEIGVIPSCLRVLDSIKDENKPYLARQYLIVPDYGFAANAMERLLIKEARFKEQGIPYTKLPIPYNPLFRARGRVHPPPNVQLLRDLQAAHTKNQWLYDGIRRRWPSVLRGLHL